MVGKAQKSHGLRCGLYGGCSDGVPPIQFFQAEHRIQFRSRPMRFLVFSNHEKGAPRQEISKWSMVCSTFSGSGWSVVRSASLAKEGTSKRRPSPHLHKVPTRSNKVSPRTLQMALVNINWHTFMKVGMNFMTLRTSPSTDFKTSVDNNGRAAVRTNGVVAISTCFNCTDYIASKVMGRRSWKMNTEVFGWNSSWPILRHYSRIRLEMTITRNYIKTCQYSDRALQLH
jgi:hypothetical protein